MSSEARVNGFALVMTFCLGCLVGAICSLLYAPQSGRRMRKQVRRASGDAQKRLVETANRAKNTVNELVDQSLERINEAVNTITS